MVPFAQVISERKQMLTTIDANWWQYLTWTCGPSKLNRNIRKVYCFIKCFCRLFFFFTQVIQALRIFFLPVKTFEAGKYAVILTANLFMLWY
jgi:hypothetical protein